jgi:hypothetical protein
MHVTPLKIVFFILGFEKEISKQLFIGVCLPLLICLAAIALLLQKQAGICKPQN